MAAFDGVAAAEGVLLLEVAGAVLAVLAAAAVEGVLLEVSLAAFAAADGLLLEVSLAVLAAFAGAAVED